MHTSGVVTGGLVVAVVPAAVFVGAAVVGGGGVVGTMISATKKSIMKSTLTPLYVMPSICEVRYKSEHALRKKMPGKVSPCKHGFIERNENKLEETLQFASLTTNTHVSCTCFAVNTNGLFVNIQTNSIA